MHICNKKKITLIVQARLRRLLTVVYATLFACLFFLWEGCLCPAVINCNQLVFRSGDMETVQSSKYVGKWRLVTRTSNLFSLITQVIEGCTRDVKGSIIEQNTHTPRKAQNAPSWTPPLCPLWLLMLPVPLDLFLILPVSVTYVYTHVYNQFSF